MLIGALSTRTVVSLEGLVHGEVTRGSKTLEFSILGGQCLQL